MAAPISIDIRKKILDDVLLGELTKIDIAKKHNVSEALVYKVIKENKTTNKYNDLINVKDILKTPNKSSNILNELTINNINIKCDDITLNKIIKELVK